MSEFEPVDSDIELLRAALSDPDAFGSFYRRHAVAVERWIRAQTPDLATAADLTAETFARALVSLDRFRGATDESARGWLYGIARNLVRRYHRRGRVELATCHNGSVSLKINRRSSIADVNRKLEAMGIRTIGKPAVAAGGDLSSIPSCSSIPPGWKGEWVQMAGSASGPGYSIDETVAPGTWVLVYCDAVNPDS